MYTWCKRLPQAYCCAEMGQTPDNTGYCEPCSWSHHSRCLVPKGGSMAGCGDALKKHGNTTKHKDALAKCVYFFFILVLHLLFLFSYSL